MQLGISSYCYVWSLGVAGYPQPESPMTASDLLNVAAASGVHAVQIADNLPLDRFTAAELRHLADHARGAEIALEVGTRGIDSRQLLTYLDIAQRLGSSLVRTVIDSEEEDPQAAAPVSPVELERVVSAIREVASAFERADVTLAIENHDRFPAATLREIMQQVDSSHVGICLDTANSIGCCEHVSLVLQTLAPWVVNVHVKDYVIKRSPHYKGFVVEGRPAGKGQLNLPEFLRQLRETSYDGRLILELWTPPQETLADSMRLEHDWTLQSVQSIKEFLGCYEELRIHD